MLRVYQTVGLCGICVRAVKAFVVASGLECQFLAVDLQRAENLHPDFLRINPKGQVPVLVDGNFVLTESNAIIRYLGRKFRSPLDPTDPIVAARADEVHEFLRENLVPPLQDYISLTIYAPAFKHVSVVMALHIDEVRVAAKKEDLRQRVYKCLDHLEQLYFPTGGNVLGPHATYVDTTLFAALESWLILDLPSLESHPKIYRWLQHMRQNDSMKRALAEFYGFAECVRSKLNSLQNDGNYDICYRMPPKTTPPCQRQAERTPVRHVVVPTGNLPQVVQQMTRVQLQPMESHDQPRLSMSQVMHQQLAGTPRTTPDRDNMADGGADLIVQQQRFNEDTLLSAIPPTVPLDSDSNFFDTGGLLLDSTPWQEFTQNDASDGFDSDVGS
ncbi:MAG: hypothetical protein MHM6MM_002551 [Cercozoa sp. M6MM]